MRTFYPRVVGALSIFAITVASGAQQVPTLSKQSAAVKQKADHLSGNARISVVRVDADEEFGKFVSNNQQGFTFYDVDHKANVTLAYDSVKKLKDGYGGYNYLSHRHVDRRKNLIVVGVFVVGLVILIVAAARTK